MQFVIWELVKKSQRGETVTVTWPNGIKSWSFGLFLNISHWAYQQLDESNALHSGGMRDITRAVFN